jgi:multiple sugar transport system permease protein
MSTDVKRHLRRGGVLVLMTAIGVVMFFPFLWMVSSSFKSNQEVLQYPPSLLPHEWHPENYKSVFTEVPFAKYMLNSFFVAGVVTAIALLTHAMAGYALACLNFRGRQVLFFAIIATMMVPFYSLLVPLLNLSKTLGWVDSYAGLIIPWIPHAFGIFLMRQHFLGFPRELRDAAAVDGAGHLRTFFGIALPTAYPVLAALAIIYFIGNWDRFLWPLIITNSPDKQTVPLGLVQFQGQYSTQWNVLMAGAVVASLPTLMLFVFLQRRIVAGVAMSGIKG